MTHQAFDDADRTSTPFEEDNAHAGLPFGLSPQILAAGLLIIALVAIAWLFFGGGSNDEMVPGLPTPTLRAAGAEPSAGATVVGAPTAAARAGATGTPPSSAASPAPLATPAAPGPSGIAEGGFVQVHGTSSYGLRLRFGPGADNATIRIANEDEVFRVMGLPETSDGTTWWRLQDIYGNIGWATEEYLVPVAAPITWSPPLASPAFGSPTAESEATSSP